MKETLNKKGHQASLVMLQRAHLKNLRLAVTMEVMKDLRINQTLTFLVWTRFLKVKIRQAVHLKDLVMNQILRILVWMKSPKVKSCSTQERNNCFDCLLNIS